MASRFADQFARTRKATAAAVVAAGGAFLTAAESGTVYDTDTGTANWASIGLIVGAAVVAWVGTYSTPNAPTVRRDSGETVGPPL
jgi:uncharacterized membrane protein